MSVGQKNIASEHLIMAADHLDRAASQYRDAAKCYDAGDDQKGAHHAFAAHGEFVLAQDHEREASKYHAGEHGS